MNNHFRRILSLLITLSLCCNLSVLGDTGFTVADENLNCPEEIDSSVIDADPDCESFEDLIEEDYSQGEENAFFDDDFVEDYESGIEEVVGDGDEDYGWYGELYWYYSEGTLYFSGEGQSIPESNEDVPWDIYRDEVTSIVIEDDVEIIEAYAFYGYSNLTSVVLGSNIYSIGDGAFYYCDSLEYIEFPDALCSIGNDAFYGCSSLSGSITIPENCGYIGAYAFGETASLNEVIIEASTDILNDCTFYYSGIENIVLPETLTEIGVSAFYGCKNLESINLPDNLESIGDYAFMESHLKNIDLPDGVVSLGEAVFSQCEQLESATLGNSLQHLPDYSFEGCSSLSDVALSSSLESIGSAAFSSCHTGITVEVGSLLYDIAYDAFDYVSDGSLVIFGAIEKYYIDDDLKELVDKFDIYHYTDLLDLEFQILTKVIDADELPVTLRVNYIPVKYADIKDNAINLTLVANQNDAFDMGHTFLIIDNETDDDVYAGPYKVYPHSSCTLGSRDRGAWFEEEKCYNVDEEAGGVDLYRNFDFLTTTISQSDLDVVVDVFQKHSSDYDFLENNCTTVAVEAWNEAVSEEFYLNIDTENSIPDFPAQTRKHIQYHKGYGSGRSLYDVGLLWDTCEAWDVFNFTKSGACLPYMLKEEASIKSVDYGFTTLGIEVNIPIEVYDHTDSEYVDGYCIRWTEEDEKSGDAIHEAYVDSIADNQYTIRGLKPETEYNIAIFCSHLITQSEYPELAGQHINSANCTIYTVKTLDMPRIVFPSEIEEGESHTAKVVYSPADTVVENVRWSIPDNNGVLAVGTDGTVQAVKEGTAILQAKIGDELDVKKLIKVISNAKITVEPTSKTIFIGQSYTITPTITGKSQTVVWKSSNPNVATVSNGKVTGKAVGTAVITAIANEKAATASVTVKKPTINISPTSVKMLKGKTKKLKAQIEGPSKKVTWKSSNKKVVTVSSSGKITAKKKGTATISATANGVTAHCKVSVVGASITLDKTNAVIQKGKSITLKATVQGKSKKVTWKSSNTKVATVKKGKVIAKKPGKATITATANGKKAKCVVTVKKYVDNRVDITKYLGYSLADFRKEMGKIKNVVIDYPESPTTTSFSMHDSENRCTWYIHAYHLYRNGHIQTGDTINIISASHLNIYGDDTSCTIAGIEPGYKLYYAQDTLKKNGWKLRYKYGTRDFLYEKGNMYLYIWESRGVHKVIVTLKSAYPKYYDYETLCKKELYPKD